MTVAGRILKIRTRIEASGKKWKDGMKAYARAVRPSPFDIGIVMLLLTVGSIPATLWETSYTPDYSTLHYLHSTIFQGLAALLGLVLIVLTLGYQLIRSNADKLEEELAQEFHRLTNTEYLNERQCRAGLARWRDEEYRASLNYFLNTRRYEKGDKNLDPAFAQAISTMRLLGSVGLQKGFEPKSYGHLKDWDERYRRAARLLMRLEHEKARYRRLPGLAMVCMIPIVFSLINSLYNLAIVSDTPRYLEHAARPAIFGVWAAALSVLYVVLYFVKVFSELNTQSEAVTLEHSGLPVGPDLDSEIGVVDREILESIAVKKEDLGKKKVLRAPQEKVIGAEKPPS